MGKGSGKGQGKGGCDLVEEGCQAAEATLCCVILMLVIGPVLLITGIAIIASAFNARGQDIRHVKNAVKFWKSDSYNGYHAFQKRDVNANISVSGSCSSLARLQHSIELKASNEQDEFKEHASSFSYQVVHYNGYWPWPSQSAANCSVTVNWSLDGNQVGSFSTSIVQRAALIVATDGCPAMLKRDTDAKVCQQNCENQGGRFSRLSANQYTCDAIQYVSKLCMRASHDGSFWVENNEVPASGPGCFYEQPSHGLGQFSPSWMTTQQQETIRIMLRSAHDPYLSFMAVTNGTLWFGSTKGENVVTGICLMAVGALLTICWVLVFYFCCKYSCGSPEAKERPNGVHGFVYDVFNKYA